jgi:hypothetical protein
MTPHQTSLAFSETPVCPYCGPNCEFGYQRCHCGCGNPTNTIPHDSARQNLVKGWPYRFFAKHRIRPRFPDGLCICGEVDCPIPYGICHCGCGKPTKIPTCTHVKANRYAGRPLTFLNGHSRALYAHMRAVERRNPPRYAMFKGKIRVFISSSQNKEIIFDVESIPLIEGRVFSLAGDGYAICRENGKVIQAHKLIGGPDAKDHIDGNILNNCIDNIRIASHLQNTYNRKLHSNNTSGYVGVTLDKRCTLRPWTARISFDGERHELGDYATREDAARARDRAALKHHGEFARLNFPEEIELRRAEISRQLDRVCQSV